MDVRDIHTTATTSPEENTGVAVKTLVSPPRLMLSTGGAGLSLTLRRAVDA
jgi:hypothetical protein